MEKGDAMMQSDTVADTDSDGDDSADMKTSGKIGIKWEFVNAGEKDGIPYTRVMLNGNHIGDYQGTCSEVGAEGGVDGKGLLTGEVAAAQCWYAGGGDEIGVFGNEDGGVDVMTGELQEPSGEGEGFRGNFKLQTHFGI
jgi:hypothetical protein